MLPLNGLGGNVPSAVRQPIFAIQFGSASPSSGLGAVASTVGSALGIGSGGADAWQDHLVSLTVEAGLAPFVDRVELVIARGSQAPVVAVGDEGSISLGYVDDVATVVFTGTIERVRQGLGSANILVSNGGAQLARLRINQSYEQQGAGKMVEEVASQAEVETDTLEDGIDFPFYVMDDGRTLYQHIAQLARKSNYAAWFTPEGKLMFVPLDEGDPVATFTYGDNILALQASDATPAAGSVTTIGEGAAGSQGSDAWSWLVKDPASVKGSAGSGIPERLIQDASLRSSDAAQSAAAAASSAASRLQITGRLLAFGAPAVVPGSTITIANAPQAIANGNFLAHRVCHYFSKGRGFTTLIAFSKIGNDGGNGLAGGLL